MAKGAVFEEGRHLSLPVPTGTVSGDPVVVGGMAGTAETDRRSDGTATVDLGGVYNHSVKGIDDTGNVAVAVGDSLYYVATDTPKLSRKRNAGKFFGIALGAVASGQTAEIPVRSAGDGSAAASRFFVSAEQTGTGAAQNIAHGLGVVPKYVLVVLTDLAGTATYVVTEGTHTATDVVVTVTSGKKYRVFAIA